MQHHKQRFTQLTDLAKAKVFDALVANEGTTDLSYTAGRRIDDPWHDQFSPIDSIDFLKIQYSNFWALRWPDATTVKLVFEGENRRMIKAASNCIF